MEGVITLPLRGLELLRQPCDLLLAALVRAAELRAKRRDLSFHLHSRGAEGGHLRLHARRDARAREEILEAVGAQPLLGEFRARRLRLARPRRDQSAQLRLLRLPPEALRAVLRLVLDRRLLHRANLTLEAVDARGPRVERELALVCLLLRLRPPPLRRLRRARRVRCQLLELLRADGPKLRRQLLRAALHLLFGRVELGDLVGDGGCLRLTRRAHLRRRAPRLSELRPQLGLFLRLQRLLWLLMMIMASALIAFSAGRGGHPGAGLLQKLRRDIHRHGRGEVHQPMQEHIAVDCSGQLHRPIRRKCGWQAVFIGGELPTTCDVGEE